MADFLSDAARVLLESAAVATIVTINPDGSPHLSSAWVGLDGDDIVFATLPDQRKLRNIRRDPRVALSVQSDRINQWGLREYLVIEGTARITEGGAAAMLQHLAHTYVGPEVIFPGMPDPPPGYVTHIVIERVRGIGDWRQSESEREAVETLGTLPNLEPPSRDEWERGHGTSVDSKISED